MFRNSIQRSPFFGDVANECFPNIRGDVWRNDCSFISTMRALLAPRMKEGDSITLRFSSGAFYEDGFTGDPEHDMRGIIPAIPPDAWGDSLIIHWSTISKEDSAACMERIRSSFVEAFTGYQQIPKITTFFQRSFDVVGFSNTERRSTILFVGAPMDMRKMHYLQMCMLPALPWFFDKSKGVSEDEMALITSLREQDHGKYIACLDKLAAGYDFRSVEIRQKLKGFESRRIEAEIVSTRRNIERIDADIDGWMGRISDSLTSREQFCVKLLGLEARSADAGDDEMMDYFICNTKLHLEDVGESTIRFVVADYLSYFDQDMAERIINKESSFVYECGSSDADNKKIAKLLRAVFVDEVLKMKVCAAYSIEIGGGVRALSGYNFSSEYDCYMPNPHIDAYACLGNYARTLAQMVRESNYIGAIEQCVASCKSLNWGDSTVARRMVQNLHGVHRNTPCIELPDCTTVSPFDGVKWLEAHECK